MTDHLTPNPASTHLDPVAENLLNNLTALFPFAEKASQLRGAGIRLVADRDALVRLMALQEKAPSPQLEALIGNTFFIGHSEIRRQAAKPEVDPRLE